MTRQRGSTLRQHAQFRMIYKSPTAERAAQPKAGQPHYGVEGLPRRLWWPWCARPCPRHQPLTGKAKWQVRSQARTSPAPPAAASVFTNNFTGDFTDAPSSKHCEQLMPSQAYRTTHQREEGVGKQYITVTTGIGGVYALNTGEILRLPRCRRRGPCGHSGFSRSEITFDSPRLFIQLHRPLCIKPCCVKPCCAKPCRRSKTGRGLSRG